MVASAQLQCHGNNLGVEHRELGTSVLEALQTVGVTLSNVIAFVSDSAAILKKAFEEVLQPVCPNAIWVPCASHILNNVAKCIMRGIDIEGRLGAIVC